MRKAAANDTKTSKFMSLVLRHKPEAAGITLDCNGWANVEELLSGMNARGRSVTLADLKRIVAEDDKARYSFSEDGTRIRANQGHSVNVDVELEESEPPELLYHGTGKRFVRSIEERGLLKMERQYVHLSGDAETAINVGRRHGAPFVFAVPAREMRRDGHKFYLSKNGVWLTDCVPAKYLRAA